MAVWAKIEDVQDRMGPDVPKSYSNPEIQRRLERAQENLRTELQSVFGTSVIAAWKDEKTTPEAVQNMTADLAAAYMFAEIFGQSYEDRESQACSFKRNVEKEMAKLRSGEKQIVDQAGAEVAEAEDRLWSSTSSKNPRFSSNHPDDADFGDGTLDEW